MPADQVVFLPGGLSAVHQVGTTRDIDDGVGCTDDSCDEAADVVVNAPNDASCDNGQFCDGAETCDPTLDCQEGTAPTVGDRTSTATGSPSW